ncbi:MAG: Ig-like domain-containing protein [Owenweeksia sp.]|nr:Ig-like domain-containing protein [Owenweeksia sp.]
MFGNPCQLGCSCACDSNALPTVALVAPADSSLHATGESINLAASITDPDSNLKHVDFFRDTLLIGCDSTMPYSVNWSSTVSGDFNITAQSTDSCGAIVTSEAIFIQVRARDCNNVIDGSAFFDSCGICSGGTTGLTANADKDTCGVCFGDNTSCISTDCNGDTAGTAAIDSCGICTGVKQD